MVCLFVSNARNPISFEDFKAYTEQQGYEFQDNRTIVPEDVIGKSCAANIEPYVQIEFAECINEDAAIKMFANYIVLADQKGAGDVKITINLQQYGSYTLESSEMYLRITRIDHTLMYTRVEKEKKDIVCNIMKDLNYLD